MFLKTIIISLIVAGVLVYIGGDPTVNYTAALALVIGNPTLTAFVDTIVNDLLSLKGITIVVQSNPPTVPKPS